MNWMYNLPIWVLFIGLMLFSVLLVTAGTLLARRAGWSMSPEDSDSAAIVYGFIGVVYAVALALIVVSVQEGYVTVQQAVIDEVNAAGDLHRKLDALDSSKRDQLQADLRRYVELVVHHEWNSERADRRSPRTLDAIDQLDRDLLALRPSSSYDEMLYGGMLGEMERMLDGRRQRLFLGQQGISPFTWTVIIMGAVITLGFCCFLPTRAARAHLLMNAAMAALFGLIIALLISMDRPLRGDFSISPHEFEQLHGRLAPGK